MKRKRLIALLLTAAMTGSLLAGCGSSGGDSGSGSGFWRFQKQPVRFTT